MMGCLKCAIIFIQVGKVMQAPDWYAVIVDKMKGFFRSIKLIILAQNVFDDKRCT